MSFIFFLPRRVASLEPLPVNFLRVRMRLLGIWV